MNDGKGGTVASVAAETAPVTGAAPQAPGPEMDPTIP